MYVMFVRVGRTSITNRIVILNYRTFVFFFICFFKDFITILENFVKLVDDTQITEKKGPFIAPTDVVVPIRTNEV